MFEPNHREGAPEGSHKQPITIEDDMDVPQSEIGVRAQDLLDRVRRCDALPARPVKAEEDDEDLSEDPWAEEEANYDKENEAIEAIDLTEDDPEPEPVKVPAGPGHCKHWRKGIRNPCCCGTHNLVTHASSPDVDFKTMQFVELKEPIAVGRYQAEFLEVCQIYYPKNPNEKRNAFVRGLPYARTRNLEGRIEPRKNEVCALVEMDTNDDRGSDVQALSEVPLDDIKAVRILHKTNKPFPECRFDPLCYQTKQDREAKAPLTCRWVMTRTYPDARYRRRGRAADGEELRHYGEADVVKGRHRASDHDRLTRWRRNQEKVPGGSYLPKRAQTAKEESIPETGPRTKTLPGQKYSVVDFFCGAGGFSKGVEMAGFKVLTACDHWSRCCETYRENFPDTDLHEKDIHEFIQEHGNNNNNNNSDNTTDLTADDPSEPVDFVHMSPPCQFYSPAHTCPGKNDMANIATLFSCEHIILIFRPRLFTVEQTFGLAQDRHSSYFNAFLQGFTRHGYSVRWKVLHLVEFGLPQTRRRLLVIGAAPGEALPGWPVPTHSKTPKGGGGQRPLVSAAQACGPLVPGVNHHDVQGARAVDRAPWDGSRPLERTITTSGGQCYHWSGRRDLTLAEFAALQGFPADFRFRSSYVKKQIGNAFPPVVVKAIMKQIRKHLEEVDNVQRLPEPSSVIIDLGGDDGDSKPVRWLKHEDMAYRDIMGSYDQKDATAAAIRASMMGSQPQSQSQSRRASRKVSGLHLKAIRSLSIKDGPKIATRTKRNSTVQNAGQHKPAHRRRSSAESITYMGESTRAGSSRQLPVIIEDREDEARADAAGPSSSQRNGSPSLPSFAPHNNPFMRTFPRLRRKSAFARAGGAGAGAGFGSGAGGAKTVAGPGSRRVTFVESGLRRCSRWDSKLWREFIGGLDEHVATDIAIDFSRHHVERRLGGGQETTDLVDDISPDGFIVDDQLQMAISLALDEAKDPKGNGKETVRKFEQYDDGQDNEPPKGKQGGFKRSCFG